MKRRFSRTSTDADTGKKRREIPPKEGSSETEKPVSASMRACVL